MNEPSLSTARLLQDGNPGQPVDGMEEAIKRARESWRRNQIAAAALRLLESSGFHQMSVNALAEEAGISVGTVYQYVDSKYDILTLLLSEIFNAYNSALVQDTLPGQNSLTALVSSYRRYCGVVDRYRPAVLLVYAETRSLDTRLRHSVMQDEQASTALIATLVRSAVESGMLRDDLDADIIAWDLTLLAHTWALKHWHFARMYSLDQYVNLQCNTLIRPYATEDGRTALEAALASSEPPSD